MRRSEQSIEPVVKKIELPIPPDRAFALCTKHMGQWWPLATHSVAGDDAIGVRFEGHVGGCIIELTDSGTEHVWAEVFAWDPPHRLVVSWHPSKEPETATTVELRFVETPEGCVVHLEHRDWEELGADDGQETRDQYDTGWDIVLAGYVEAAKN